MCKYSLGDNKAAESLSTVLLYSHGRCKVRSLKGYCYGPLKEKRFNDGPVLGTQVAMVECEAALHCLAQLLVLQLRCSPCKSRSLSC